MLLAKDGFVVRFTQPLDPKLAQDAANWKLERWRYKYQPQYGSKKFEKGPVAVRSVRPSEDGRSATLLVESGDKGLRAGWMFQLTTSVKSREGETPTTNRAWYTLNRLR